MNTYMATGNLTRDPELRDLDGRSECKLRLAVDNGPYPTTFIDVRTFDAQAEACATYLHKGRRVGVHGRLALAEWNAKDGSPRQRYSVIGRVEFLDRRSGTDVFSGDRGGPVDDLPRPETTPELALVA
jgi:single-strand DNA-binding protein